MTKSEDDEELRKWVEKGFQENIIYVSEEEWNWLTEFLETPTEEAEIERLKRLFKRRPPWEEDE